MISPIRNIIKKGKDLYFYKAFHKMSYYASLDDKGILTNKNVLTSDMKNEIFKLWGKVIPSIKLGYVGYQAFLQYHSFDPRFIPSAYYYPYIIRTLNPKKYYRAFENKCLYPILFQGITQPRTIAMRVNGIFYIRNHIVNKKMIIDVLSNQNTSVLIKQSIDSCCGRNIAKIDGNYSRNEISSILDNYSSDFIIQEFITSSESTSIFNPTSLNTFRISTLFLNGVISVCSMAIKLGKPGNIVDNIGGEGGGIMVGINDRGILDNYGITSSGELRKTHNGIVFGGRTIKAFPEVVELAKKAHSQFPYCGIVGWDIALNKDNKPILIEANIWWPGTLLEQICSGPFLGERTEEVIDYMKSNELHRID